MANTIKPVVGGLLAMIACGATAAAQTPLVNPTPANPALAPADTLSRTWRKTWPMIVGIATAKAKAPPQPALTDLAGWTAQQAAADTQLQSAGAGAAKAYGVVVEAGKLGEVPVLTLTPKGWTDDGRVLVYVHGGGFTGLSARSTIFLSGLMASRAGLRVVSVDYTLAPGQRWAKTTDQVIAVYRALLAQGYRPDGIGIFGDSAGGSIVGGSVLKLRDAGLPMPAAVLLLSPWSDVTMAGDTYRTLAAYDPLLDVQSLKISAEAYADPADQKNPYVSPVYGDYSKGFPPTLIQGGTREIFLSNMVRQYQAMIAGNVDATLDLYEGMIHVFQPMAPGAPENIAAMKRSVGFLKQHLRPR